jgi:O-antigen ligase
MPLLVTARLGERRRSSWLLLGIAAAVAVGAVAAVDTTWGVAVTLGVALAVAVVFRPTLILIILILSVFIEIVSFGGVTVSRVIAPVALVVTLAVASHERARLRPSAPAAWAYLYVLWVLASGLWTVSLSGTAFLLASLAIALIYAAAFASLVTAHRELEHVLYALAGAALLTGLFAIATYLLQYSPDLQEGRAQGATGDPNFFAAYQLVALPLVLVLAGKATRWLRTGLYVTVLVIVGSIFTTLSRGGLLTLLVITIVMLALPAKALFRSRMQKGVAIVVVIAGLATALSLSSDSLALRLETEDKTGSGRLIAWNAALLSFEERPYLGLGYGAFAAASNDLIRHTPDVSFRHYELSPDGVVAHSLYIGTLAELGVPGLVILLGLLLSTALALRRVSRRAALAGDQFLSQTANALLVGLLAWSLSSIFLSSETSRPFWIMFGLALALPRLLSHREQQAAAKSALMR